MKIIVNDVALELFMGARVRDAVMKYFTESGKKIPRKLPDAKDRYGNIVSPDGELSEGNILFIGRRNKKGAFVIQIVAFIIALTIISACGTGKKVISGDAGEEREAAIFAVNDMHATIDNFPKLAYIVDSLRVIYPDMLLVAAGDNQTGNPVNDMYPEKGFPIIDLMNATGFSLSAVGNHEFDSRPGGFSTLTQKASFSFVCANMTASDSLKIRVSPYKIFSLPNGLKLAFFGLLQINPNGIPDSHPDNLIGFAFRSPFEAAPEYLYLRKQNDILIAITHLGFESDVKLAGTLPAGIDLIIGGHSHTRVDKEQVFNGILITQAENKLKYGTLIRLKVRKDGSVISNMHLIDIRNSKKEKESIRAMVDKYNDNPFLNQVIATASDDFSTYEEAGYLMADAQRDAAQADIALVNPGGVRLDNIPEGPIRIMNIYQLDPFGNELVVTKLTGNEIRDLMMAAFPVDDKLPVYPSGIRTIVKLDSKGNPEDIALLTESGSQLEMNRTYTVAMNNYMTQVYKYDHADPGQSLFITTADATIGYLKKNKTIKSYRGEKRIQVIRSASTN
jgi:5'-nucleotidase